MTDITELAQRTDLLMDNALETAKQLRELSESPVAEAIFESIVENENGKEIQFERPISDLAYAAFLQLERLVEALEKAQARSSKWLEAYHKAVSVGARYEERIAELESRTVTVKLPRPGFVTISGERTAVYLKADVDAAMLAAGIEETK